MNLFLTECLLSLVLFRLGGAVIFVFVVLPLLIIICWPLHNLTVYLIKKIHIYFRYS